MCRVVRSPGLVTRSASAATWKSHATVGERNRQGRRSRWPNRASMPPREGLAFSLRRPCPVPLRVKPYSQPDHYYRRTRRSETPQNRRSASYAPCGANWACEPAELRCDNPTVCTFCQRPARKRYALARRSGALAVYRSQRRPAYQTPVANTARAAIEPPTTASANDELPDDPEASAGD